MIGLQDCDHSTCEHDVELVIQIETWYAERRGEMDKRNGDKVQRGC